MNQVARNTILLLLGIFVLILLLASFYDKRVLADIGGMGALAGIALVCLGIFFCFFKNSRDFATGLLISGLLMIIIGFGVCSANFSLYPQRTVPVSK